LHPVSTAARVIGSESCWRDTARQRDAPGTRSWHCLPLSAQLWANLSSSDWLFVQKSALTSWSPGSQALHTWLLPSTPRSWRVARVEASCVNGQGRAGMGAASAGERQRGERARPGLLVRSKAGAGAAVAALRSPSRTEECLAWRQAQLRLQTCPKLGSGALDGGVGPQRSPHRALPWW